MLLSQQKKRAFSFLCAAVILSLFALTTISCSSGGTADTAASQNPDLSEKTIADFPKSSLIDVNALKNLMSLQDPNLVIIGTLDSKKALIPGNTARNPIDGSYLVWRPDYSGSGSTEALSTEVGGFRSSKEQMAELLSKAGATTASTIVVYSADAMHDATRLWWQIKLIGHDDVRVLDGGLNAWQAAGFETGKGIPLAKQEAQSSYQPSQDRSLQLNATTDQVIKTLQNQNEWVVIDTRSIEEFEGQKTGSSAGAFGTGRLKGSVSIPWNDTVNGDTQLLKTVDELTALYGDTIKDKKVVVYCQSGVRSAHTYFVLTELLGVTDVYNYDGSWIEWSYAASEASNDDVSAELKASVLEFTEEWTDYKKAI